MPQLSRPSRILLGSVLTSFFCAVSPATAIPIIASPTGLPGALQTITFSEFVFSTGTPITTEYASLGVTFSPNLYYDSQPGYLPTPSVNNFSFCCGPLVDPSSLVFSSVVTGAAFEFITNAGTSTFTALLNGSVIEFFSASTDLTTGRYFGFADISFNEIRIDAGGSNDSLGLDNLQTSPVPEPATLLLLGAGLGGLAMRSRRRQR